MSEPEPSAQNDWISLDLEEDERQITWPKIDDGTEIVRYIRLSTLFLHLSDRAFIPNLRCLRGLDPWEGQLSMELNLPTFQAHLRALLARFADFLRGEAIFPATHPRPPLPPDLVDFSVRVQRWLAELAKRRAIWCWNLFDGHSNALWQLYGQRGVAIHSTVGLVKTALSRCAPFRALVAPIRYALPSRFLTAAETFDPSQKATWPPWFMRPYLYKLNGYRYERELRFVFGVHPTLSKEASGIIAELDAKTLIQKLSISPDTAADEAEVIQDLFSRFKAGDLALHYPTKHDELWKLRFELVSGSPFTMADDYPELFPDLDF